MNLDAAIVLFFQENLRSALLDPIMLFVTTIGEVGAVWLLTGLVLLLFKKTRRGGLVMLLSLLLGFVLNNLIIKNLVQRPRPYVSWPEISSAVGAVSEWSFASGHATSSFACATALALCFGKKGALAYILAVLIAVSRVYIGVHYPTDILAGAVIGALCAFGVNAASIDIVRRLGYHRDKR